MTLKKKKGFYLKVSDTLTPQFCTTNNFFLREWLKNAILLHNFDKLSRGWIDTIELAGCFGAQPSKTALGNDSVDDDDCLCFILNKYKICSWEL